MDMGFGGDMMGMGAMDMGMGAMDMGMGAMDMGIGAMDMGMGMGGLGAGMMGMGAMEMGMGAMDMGMGMGMMDMGMGMGGMGMMDMGMGMGMMGMGMGGGMMMQRDMMAMDMGLGMGMMATDMALMGGGIGICPVGCMRQCCRPVVVCPPGCQRSCCVRQEVIYVNQNAGFIKQPPIQVVNRPYQQQPNVNNISAQRNPNVQYQNQRMAQQQAKLNQQRTQQMQYKQKLQQEQIRLQRQKMQITRQKLQQRRMQQMKEQEMINNLKKEQYCEQNYQQTITNQVNPYQKVLYEGKLYQQSYGNWSEATGSLTADNFLNYNMQRLSKIKVKYESHVPGTKVIKLTFDGHGDVFVSVPSQFQQEWMCQLIWVRLNLMGKNSNLYDTFTGCVQGEIVRKSFLKGWEVRYGAVTASSLRISGGKGGAPSQVINAVPEIWTRFEIMHGNMLVVKMHSGGRKQQIGIPLSNCISWLKGLYSLVRA